MRDYSKAHLVCSCKRWFSRLSRTIKSRGKKDARYYRIAFFSVQLFLLLPSVSCTVCAHDTDASPSKKAVAKTSKSKNASHVSKFDMAKEHADSKTFDMAKEHAGSKTFDMAKEHAGSKTTEKAISADGDLDVAGTTVVRAPQRKQNWFYCGVSLGLAHLYPKTASYTKGHIAKGTTREHKVIYYGSYAYNRDSFLVDSGIFCGYCATVLRKILLGAELRGGVSFRESEISSNGVFSEVGKDPIEQGWPETFTDHNGEAVKEADFSYSRQTLRQSRFVTLLPRIGAALSESTSVYALLGIKYGWWQITDHPEEIEVITTYNAKEHKDVIYSGGCVSYIGGICLETSLFERGLLRFECLYSPGPKLEIERQTLQEEYDTADVNRQLESLKINSIKHISFGVSVGVKF